MNDLTPKRASPSLSKFSEEKKGILNDIRTKWGKFSEDDLDRLESNDDLVSELVTKYGIERVKARRDVNAMLHGRQL